MHPPLARGVIKQTPEDFVVQELSEAGEVAAFDGSNDTVVAPVIRGVMTKKGLSTTAARHVLADELRCSVGKIGIAGLKDVEAHTAQFVTIHGALASPITLPNLTLHSLEPYSDILRVGSLSGNRFTITVALLSPITESALKKRLAQIQKEGFPNLFGPQRFGPRGINHIIGEQLLRGNYDEAAKLLVTKTSPLESDVVTALREKALENWGDWKKLVTLFGPHKGPLRSEYLLVSFLKQGKTVLQFWNTISPQSRFFAYSYGSHLFNEVLQEGKPLPQTITTIADTPEAHALYGEALNLLDLEQTALPCIKPKAWQIPTRITPTIHSWSLKEDTATLSFDLPKGAYATTFLSQIFDLKANVSEYVLETVSSSSFS